MSLTLQCAWCKRIIRDGDTLLPVSHGICLSCRVQMEASEMTPEPKYNRFNEVDDREYVHCDLCDTSILDGAAENGRIGRLYLCPECYDKQTSVVEGREWEHAQDVRGGK